MITTSTGAKKLESSDNWREIFPNPGTSAAGAHNASVDAQDRIQAEVAPIINGKRCAVGAASGDYVLLRNSTIAGKTDGAYKATKAIPADTDLDSTYLGSPITGGMVNELNNNITTLNNRFTYSYLADKTGSIGLNIKNYIGNGYRCGVFLITNASDDKPDTATSYRIRYTLNSGSSGAIVEAWDYTDLSKYYITNMDSNTGVVDTWNRFAISSEVTEIADKIKGKTTSSFSSGTATFVIDSGLSTLYKSGNVVTMSLCGTATDMPGMISGFASLPNGYRPKSGIKCDVYCNYAGSGMLIRRACSINTDGTISIAIGGGTISGTLTIPVISYAVY